MSFIRSTQHPTLLLQLTLCELGVWHNGYENVIHTKHCVDTNKRVRVVCG